jgi:hypothetical protein
MSEPVNHPRGWTACESRVITGETLVYDGTFIVARVTRKSDAEMIVKACKHYNEENVTRSDMLKALTQQRRDLCALHDAEADKLKRVNKAQRAAYEQLSMSHNHAKAVGWNEAIKCAATIVQFDKEMYEAILALDKSVQAIEPREDGIS